MYYVNYLPYESNFQFIVDINNKLISQMYDNKNIYYTKLEVKSHCKVWTTSLFYNYYLKDQHIR